MKGKRFVSCVLSGALALGLPVSGLSYADEMPAAVENSTENTAGTQNDEVPTAQVPETLVPQTDTEAPDFRLILSDQDAYHLTWDQNHFKETTKEGETTLLYKAGDEVILDMETEPGYQIDKVIFADTDDIVRDQIHAEVPFEWKDEDTLTFTMPGNDVWMHTEYHMLSSEAAVPVAQTDNAVAVTNVSEGSISPSETPAAETALPETSAYETGAEQDLSGQENGQQPQDAGQPDANAAPDETAGDLPEDGNENSASVIGADGFPAQGSVMMLSEIELASDLTDLPEDKFEDVTYPKDTVQTTLAQNDVKLGTPGIYTVVYRADEATTGKFWFLVRPVRIVENRKEPESQTENGTEHSSASDDQSGETESDDSDDPDSQNSSKISTESDTEAEITLEDMTEADLPAMDETEADTEADTESDTESEGGSYQVILKEGSEYNVVLNHEDGYYEVGEKVVIRSDIDAASSNIAAWRTVNHDNNDTGDYCEITYDPQDNSNSFIMPAEDVELSVSRDVIEGASPRRMAPRKAAAADDDSDGGWNDQTDVEAGKYYYHTDGNYTGHVFNNDLGYGGADSYKWVRYKVNGVTYDVMAYCMQHNLHSPASGTTYTKMTELDEGGDDKYLRKAMFYGYGGPGWKGTFNGYSIKAIFNKYGVGSNAREMQHYLVDYLYDGSSGYGGMLSTKGKNLLKECKAALKKMPDPTNTSIGPATSVVATSKTSPSFTWNANAAFVITINLENGVSLVNEATGAVSTGSGQVAGGQSFHFVATVDNTAGLTGKYSVTGNYPLDFHAMALKVQNKQDIGFGYVEEKNRSWCSSSNANDQRAVTIECASDNAEPYAFRDVVYQRLIELCIDICKRNGKNKLIWFGDKDKTLNYSPKSGEMILTVHRWFANKSCPGNWMYARMGDLAEKVTKALQGSSDSGSSSDKTSAKGMQASVLKDLSEADAIKKVGALFTADQKKSGILASISLVQFILESGYGKSELAQNANNLFGIKCSLSGNTWSGSSWDGKSKYTKKTQEQNKDGSMETITADFRKYFCIEDSIADHSAYLLGAKNGSKARYDGLKGCTDYKKAVQIIKDGGYATSLTYVEKLCSIIEKWKLTDYDVKDSGGSDAAVRWYRVRKSWSDSKTQKGAYKILDNAKKCADQNPGYKVFDADGKVVYEPKAAEPAVKVPFLVKVSIKDLNIRKGPGTGYDRVQFCPVGVYTIVEVKSGAGSKAGWGRLKSGIGYISLDFVQML